MAAPILASSFLSVMHSEHLGIVNVLHV